VAGPLIVCSYPRIPGGRCTRSWADGPDVAEQGQVAGRLDAVPGRLGQAAHALASHAHGPHALGAHGVLFADAFALIAEPEITEPARRAARTIADHLADLIRRGQADGDIRADLDPEPAAWLVLSVLSTRAFRATVMPGRDRLEDGVTALLLQALIPPDQRPAARQQ
jgi:hypothetical protein